jgi:Proton-conducting membrane transporter/LAGLIDADG DNA endonuclease family
MWEAIGVVSYLLINFYFTRIQANKAAILAFTMNRSGDMLMSIGFFAIFAIFGSLNYASIFSITPYMNETSISIIALFLLGGALAKSANIPLHSWLPGSMEAFKGVCLTQQAMQQLYFFFYCYLIFILYNYHSSYAYDINCLYILPFINSIPTSTLQAITGNMLGDGSISLSNKFKGQGKFSMTMVLYSLNYLIHFYNNIYSQFTDTNIYPYTNILLGHHKDKKVTQYHFKTKTHYFYTALHSLWYRKDNEGNKFIKIVPLNKYIFVKFFQKYH